MERVKWNGTERNGAKETEEEATTKKNMLNE